MRLLGNGRGSAEARHDPLGSFRESEKRERPFTQTRGAWHASAMEGAGLAGVSQDASAARPDVFSIQQAQLAVYEGGLITG